MVHRCRERAHFANLVPWGSLEFELESLVELRRKDTALAPVTTSRAIRATTSAPSLDSDGETLCIARTLPSESQLIR